MPGQWNRTANSWGRRRALERERASKRARLMPPSGAECRDYGAARTRTRARYVRHRYSVSRPPLPGCASYFYYTSRPHRGIADTLTFPYRPSVGLPFLPLLSLHPLQQSRAPVVAPATTSCVCPTLSLPIYMCTYASMYAHITPYRHRPTSLLPATRHRRASTENKIGALTAGRRRRPR